jgi:hypothetical protein
MSTHSRWPLNDFQAKTLTTCRVEPLDVFASANVLTQKRGANVFRYLIARFTRLAQM